jgi:hypothetical protein
VAEDAEQQVLGILRKCGTHRRRLLLDPRIELSLLGIEHLHHVTHRDEVCALARRASGCGAELGSSPPIREKRALKE